ncbi:DUF6503 family protein [Altibacter sp. HG106]|uniref:DUF6503 family protein n=1 Tax=Altibacter sp. HG106 TaxID=3023937 RepID=UPI0023505A9D|nr:DUF6503 family protein [Altibacter sp. HG106]MDC7995564.1 deoxyribose-phosphate aldolase [Altibacter sp. HG106]
MNWKFVLLSVGIILTGCQPKTPETARQIIDKAIANACSGRCEHAEISFEFRGKQYTSKRQAGAYRLERRFVDSTGSIVDVLDNNGFIRKRNDTVVHLSDSLKTLYGNSVNSVHYFTQLPFGLNDPAVQKKVLGRDTIFNQPYYEIQVTFKQEGGGTDFEDEFVYWIHAQEYTVDYLAYSYATDGGGIRFREAYNPRVINGIRFVDYRNFKPETVEVSLHELDDWFQEDSLQLLSTIENTHIEVGFQTP